MFDFRGDKMELSLSPESLFSSFAVYPEHDSSY